MTSNFRTPIAVLNTVFATFSIVLSFMVVLTGMSFRSMMKSSFFRTIFTIAVSDFFSSLFYSFGAPPQGTDLCSAQGFAASLFARSSFFFTAGLTVQLYYVVVCVNTKFSELWMHIICWTSTLFLGLIPLAGNIYYGVDAIVDGIEPCSLYSGDNNSISAQAYTAFYFGLPALLCFAVLVVVTILVRYHIAFRMSSNADTIASATRLKSLASTIQLYPLALLCTWLPKIYSDYMLSTTPEDMLTELEIRANGITNAVGLLYGTWLGIIFFVNSREARQRWRSLLCHGLENHRSSIIEIDDDLEYVVEDHIRLSRASERSTVIGISSNSTVELQSTAIGALHPAHTPGGNA